MNKESLIIGAKPSPASGTKLSNDGEQLKVKFTQDLRADDVVVSLQFSSNLINWSEVSRETNSTYLGNHGMQITLEAPLSELPDDNIFFRVHLRLRQPFNPRDKVFALFVALPYGPPRQESRGVGLWTRSGRKRSSRSLSYIAVAFWHQFSFPIHKEPPAPKPVAFLWSS